MGSFDFESKVVFKKSASAFFLPSVPKKTLLFFSIIGLVGTFTFLKSIPV